MAYAQKLAARIRNVLEKQVQEKGYEVEVLLINKKQNDNEGLMLTSIEDAAESRNIIKIIVTEFDQEEWPMELGDNSRGTLDFIRIETENTPEGEQIMESNLLEYAGEIYHVVAVAPTGLGGLLIIKECKAEKVL